MSLIFKNSQTRLTSVLHHNLLNNEINNIIRRNINLSTKINPIKYDLSSIKLNNENKLGFNLSSNLIAKRLNSTSKEKGILRKLFIFYLYFYYYFYYYFFS